MGARTPSHDLLEELRALDADARRSHVADALERDAHALRGLAPLALARLLGVPDPEHPGAGWSISKPPPMERLEDHDFGGRVHGTLWPLVRDDWPSDRRARLERAFRRCDDEGRLELGALNADERAELTRRLIETRAAELRRAGLGAIAAYAIRLPDGRALCFDCGLDENGDALDLSGPRLVRPTD